MGGGLPASRFARLPCSRDRRTSSMSAARMVSGAATMPARHGNTWPCPARKRSSGRSDHPKNPNVLLVGTEVTTIYRSENDGASCGEGPCPERRREDELPDTRCCASPWRRRTRMKSTSRWRSAAWCAARRWQDLGRLQSEPARFTEQPKYRSKIGSDTETEGMMDSHALAVSAQPSVVFLANRMGLFRKDRARTWKDMEVGTSHRSPMHATCRSRRTIRTRCRR